MASSLMPQMCKNCADSRLQCSYIHESRPSGLRLGQRMPTPQTWLGMSSTAHFIFPPDAVPPEKLMLMSLLLDFCLAQDVMNRIFVLPSHHMFHEAAQHLEKEHSLTDLEMTSRDGSNPKEACLQDPTDQPDDVVNTQAQILHITHRADEDISRLGFAAIGTQFRNEIGTAGVEVPDRVEKFKEFLFDPERLRWTPKGVTKEVHSDSVSISLSLSVSSCTTGAEDNNRHIREVIANTKVENEGDDSKIRGHEGSTSCSMPCIDSDSEGSFVFNVDSGPSASPQENATRLALQEKIVTELVTQFVSEAYKPRTYGQQSSQDRSSRWRTSTTDFDIASGSSLTAPPSSHRARGVEDDDEGDTRRSKRARLCHSTSAATERLLACPYAKYDPNRYSERNSNPNEKHYRGCASRHLTSIARVKQHLYRAHRRPDHHCSCCFSRFDDDKKLAEHNRQRPPCDVADCPFEERMTVDQYKAVKRRDIGKNRVEAWFDIFKILFPGAATPLEPYADSAPAEAIDDFLAFFQREAPSRLSMAYATALHGAGLTEDLQSLQDVILEECIVNLVQELRREFQHPTLGRQSQDGRDSQAELVLTMPAEGFGLSGNSGGAEENIWYANMWSH